MSYARVTYPDLTGTQDSFTVPFDFEDPTEIEVSLAGEAVSSSRYTFEGDVLRFIPPDFPVGTLVIRRRTDLSELAVSLIPSSPIRTTDLIAVHTQVLHGLQEVYDGLEFLDATIGPDGRVELPKSAVGLSQVDNTSDLDKPISTATQEALDLKLNRSEFNLDNLFEIVVDLSGGVTGINAETLQGETPASLKDWRQATNKPSAYPPTPHVHKAEDITSGSLAPARVPEAAVTQHQAKLLINYGQLRGVPPGALGEVTDGKTYIRTQGRWVEFDPEENEILSGLGISLSDILGD